VATPPCGRGSLICDCSIRRRRTRSSSRTTRISAESGPYEARVHRSIRIPPIKLGGSIGCP
jgi:hypothetical protein